MQEFSPWQTLPDLEPLKGVPLGQYLADFEIRSGKIDLNGLIDVCGNRAANVSGQFYQTRARTPKNTPQNQPHHQRLPPRSIFCGFRNPKWQNRSKRVDRCVRQQGGERRWAVFEEWMTPHNCRPAKLSVASGQSHIDSDSIRITMFQITPTFKPT